MFSSVETLLQKANGSEVNFLWVKYFTDNKAMPKNFLDCFPQFKDNTKIFNFNRLETKNVKKAIANITEKKVLQETLIQLFDLNGKITPESLEVFQKVNNLTITKTNKKAAGFLFRHAIRIFARIVAQIPNEISNVLDKHLPMSFIFESLHRIIFFFSLYDGKKFMNFHVFLLCFLNHFSYRFDDILQPTTPIPMQEACLTFMGALVACSRVYLKENPGTESPIITFITQQFDKMFVIMEGSSMTKTIAAAIRTTISSLVPYVEFLSADQCHNLGCISLSLIASILKSTNLDTTEIYQTCSICMKLYNELCKFEGKAMQKYQFTSIVLFIIWLITTCPDAILEDIRDVPQTLVEPEKLGPINRTNFFTTYGTIDDYKNLVISKRLSAVAELILSICKHFKDPSPFVANLIDSIKEQEEKTTQEQYRTFVAFVLYLIGKVPEGVVNSAVNNNWGLIISPIIFPPDTTIPSDVRLRNTVLIIVLRTFINEPQSRDIILLALSDYFEKNPASGKAYFMLLLNSLLIVEDSIDFIKVLSSSPLLLRLIDLSRTSLIMFDFLRICAAQQPAILLTNADMVNFCIDNIEDPKYTDSIFNMFFRVFYLTQKDQTMYKPIGILMKFLSKRIESMSGDIAIRIVETALSMSPTWPVEFITNSTSLKQFIDSISIIPVNHFSTEIFIRLIQQYANLISISPVTFYFMTQPELTLYSNLKKAAAKKTEESDECTRVLLEFAHASSDKSSEHRSLRNYKALEVLMEWSKGSVKEKEILLKLSRLAYKSTTNIYQMNRACLPEHILQRLQTVGNDIALISEMLQLFSVLARYAFTNSVLYEGIRLMRSEQFMNPNLILSTYFRLITDFKEPGPSCFFHFDGTATGIFGPTTVIPDQSLFVTSFCVDGTFGKSVQPIVIFDSGTQEYLSLILTGDKLVLTSTSNQNTQKITGKQHIDTEKWIQVAISFTVKSVTVYLDGKLEMQCHPIPLGSCSYKIFIGSSTESMTGEGLVGDIGPTYLLKGADVSKITLELLPNDIEKTYGKDTLLMYSPRATQQTSVLNVSSEATSVSFRGQTIQFTSTIIDVISSVAAIPNLMPIFQRVYSCEHCVGEHSAPCPYCHSISTPNGEETVIILLQIFTMLFQHSKTVQMTFKSIRGYKLLSGFLSKVSAECINERTLSSIIEMFHNSKDIELARQAIKDIFLNFDFISRLKVELQTQLFSTLLYKAFSVNPEPFTSLPSLEFVIFRAMTLSENKSPIADLVWQFLMSLVSKVSTSQLCATLIAIIANTKDPLILSPVLDILLLLIDNSSDSINKVISLFNYYLPFSFSMSNESSNVKSKTLQIIQRLNSPEANLEEFTLLSLISLKEDEDKLQQGLVMNRISRMLFGTLEKDFEMPQILPLFVSFLKLMPIEDAKEYYQKFRATVSSDENTSIAITSVTNWYYWIIEMCTIFFDPATQMKDIIAPFLFIFSKQMTVKTSEDMSEFFTFLDIKSLEYRIDFSPMKKKILCYLIGIDNSESFSIILKEAFKYIFIHLSIDNPNKAPDLIPDVLKKTLPTQKYLPTGINFGIRLDEKGVWTDLDLAKAIISFTPHANDFAFKITDFDTIGSFETIAYIASYVARYDKRRFLQALPYFIGKLKTINYDSAYTTASILYATIQKYNIKFDDVSKLTYFVDYYVDDCDSPQLQYFMFEDKICSHLTMYLGQYIVDESELIQTMETRVEKILGIGNAGKITVTANDSSIIEAIVRTTKPQCYSPLKGAFDRFWSRQKDLLDADRAEIKKHMNSFLRELSLGGGPWADKRVDEHFKAPDYISSRGSRVLLSINHNFDDHKKASELRDSGKSNAETKQFLPRFKIGTGGPLVIKHEGYRTLVQRVSPRSAYNGEISILGKTITFNGRKANEAKNIEITCTSVEFILSRKQNYQEVACEIFVNDNHSYYFVFSSPEERNNFYKALAPNFPPRLEFESSGKFFFFSELRKAEGGRIQTLASSELIKKINLTEKWTTRKISTYEYLYYLNLLSGRSFNDLSQYPVYPWVIRDYESEKIDLSKQSTYRDLSLPIGALNKNRIEMLKILYADFPDPAEKCLYRSHFSSMAAVSSYLIRVEPFTSLHILLQEGRFDVPGRLFSSVLKDWQNVTSEESDFRELIPEFFSFPEFLLNNSHYDLGCKRETGEKVDDVVLPPWASSPWEFVSINRQALESDITSKTINKWIDLIFGVNRCSLEANNVFHPLSYPEKERGPDVLPEQIHNHCVNFGICPDQLFFEPHAQRNEAIETSVLPDTVFESDIISIRKGLVFLANGAYSDLRNGATITKKLPGSFGDLLCASSIFKIAVFKQKFDNFVTCVELETRAVHTVSHDAGAIRSATLIGGIYLITGGTDCSLRIWGLPGFVLLHISTLHSDQVTAVAGCMESGLVASLDKHGLLITETLRKGKFICSTEISIISNNPFLYVLKSGLVVCADPTATSTTITVFDSKLNKLASTNIEGKVTELHKARDEYGCEFIIAASENQITVFEAFSLRVVASFNPETDFPHICPLRRKRGFICGIQNSLKHFVY